MKKLLAVLMPFLFGGCLDLPEGVKPVNEFDLDRYKGKWYEIARLDHSFERGMEQVTAEYSLNDDGSVKVLNRGFKSSDQKWKDAQGKALFVGESDLAHLKVSFFGPFYGSYGVFELGDDYEYSFVSGSNTKYLWFLSRTPAVSDSLKKHFVSKVEELGFPAEELIWVKQGE